MNIHTVAFPSGEIRGQVNFAGTGLPVATWVGIGAATLMVALLGGRVIYRRRLRARVVEA